MKRTIFSMVIAGLVASCAPNPGPIFIRAYRPVDQGTGNQCAGAKLDAPAIVSGVLDVGQGAQFWVSAEVAGINNVTTVPVVLVSGETLERANRERAIVEELVLTYAALPTANPRLTPERVTLAVPLGTGEEAALQAMPINLIGPNAEIELNAQFAARTDISENNSVTVTAEMRGKLTGSGNAFSTGPFAFNIKLYNSQDATTCGALRFARTGPCGSSGGQSDFPPQPCCDAFDGGVAPPGCL